MQHIPKKRETGAGNTEILRFISHASIYIVGLRGNSCFLQSLCKIKGLMLMHRKIRKLFSAEFGYLSN